jgi:hypothetical protein
LIDNEFVINDVKRHVVGGSRRCGIFRCIDVAAFFPEDELLAESSEEVERKGNQKDHNLVQSPPRLFFLLLLLLELRLDDD